MAAVPYDQHLSAEPFATVTPRDGIPDDYQHIQASPEMFGALVAQGIVDLHGCALQVNLGAAPVPGSSFTILTNSGGYTTNAFAAGSQVVTVNNTNYIVRVRTTSSGATATCNLLTQGMCLIIE